MVDMTRELARMPAREPLVSLAAVVRDFKWRYPRSRRDMVVEYCRTAPTLGTAIGRAVASKGADGKHHNHQSKIRRDKYAPFLAELRLNRRTIRGAESFHMLHLVVERCAAAVGGWGPVGVYDVATRIGAFLGLEPCEVYLHAGVEKGLVSLVGPAWVASHAHGVGVARCVPMHMLPAPLTLLTADEVEDLLCTYRAWFERERFAELGLAWVREGAERVGSSGDGVARRRKVRRLPNPKGQ